MFVFDTNVVSELMRPVPHPVIASWVAERATSNLFLTAVTEAELRCGLAVMPLGKRRDGLAKGLERMLETGFANRVLPFDSGAARVYAGIAAARRRMGRSDHTNRLSNRGHCPLTRYGGGNAQHSGLRGHGNRHIQPMGRRMSGTTEPRDSLAGSSGRCSRSMGVSTCAIPQPHRIDGLVALQELTQAGGVPV